MAILRPALGMLDGGIFDIFGEGIEGLSESTIVLGMGTENRWRGQTSRPWPISAHSLAVRHVLILMDAAPIVQLAGATHDVEESILGDVPTPLKRSMFVRTPTDEIIEYEELERRTRRRCIRALGLHPDVADLAESGPVKLADHLVLHAEARQLCHGNMPGWLGPLRTEGVDPKWFEGAMEFVSTWVPPTGEDWLRAVRAAG